MENSVQGISFSTYDTEQICEGKGRTLINMKRKQGKILTALASLLLVVGPSLKAAPPTLTEHLADTVISAEEISQNLTAITDYVNAVAALINEQSESSGAAQQALDDLYAYQGSLQSNHQAIVSAMLAPTAQDLSGQYYCNDSLTPYLYNPNSGYAAIGWTHVEDEWVFTETGSTRYSTVLDETELGFFGNPFGTKVTTTPNQKARDDNPLNLTGYTVFNWFDRYLHRGQRGQVAWRVTLGGQYDPPGGEKGIWQYFDIGIVCSEPSAALGLGGAQ